MKKFELVFILGMAFQVSACTSNVQFNQGDQPEEKGFLEELLGGFLNTDGPSEPTQAILNTHQTLQSFQLMTGGVAEDETYQTYAARRESLPATGVIEEATPGAWMAITMVGGQFCVQTVQREAALPNNQRIFFSGFNFNAGPENTGVQARSAAVRVLARRFWSRNETPAELSLILNEINDPVFSQANTVVPTAIAACSIMIAGLPAIDISGSY